MKYTMDRENVQHLLPEKGDLIALKLTLQDVVRTAVVAALAVGIQALNLSQMITGPAINAILYIASIFIGPISGLMVGLVTPWVALLTGIMQLVPAVPVIMVGNAVLCLVAGYLDRFNRYLAMGLAAVCKFIAMTVGIKILIGRGTNVPGPVYSVLTINQLVTALLGAVLASIVLVALEAIEGK